MSNSILRDKAKIFAKNIVFLCRNMKAEHKETVLINQLLRSGTSIGANIHEAQYAQGTKDFISYPNLKLRKRNVMKQNIGLNFYLKPVVLKNPHTKLFKTIAELFDEC